MDISHPHPTNIWYQETSFQTLFGIQRPHPGKFQTNVFVFITGLGDTVDSDRETVEQLVKKLKEEIKYINAFVILFNGQV